MFECICISANKLRLFFITYYYYFIIIHCSEGISLQFLSAVTNPYFCNRFSSTDINYVVNNSDLIL